MAINAAKQLLDELMGRQRDLGPNESASAPDWNDPAICKNYIIYFCPNTLFTNTKADIGPCNLLHDENIKKEFETRASRHQKRQYENSFVDFVQKILSDVDKRIKRAKQRLEMSKLETSQLNNELNCYSDEVQQKIKALSDKIDKLLEEIERLGFEGKVEEAQMAMVEVEKLKDQRIHIKRENGSSHWVQHKGEIGVAQEKQMEVCDVCGAFLIVNDVQQRVEDHLTGKQHVGFGRLKLALEEIYNRRQEEKGNHEDTQAMERDNHDGRRERRHRQPEHKADRHRARGHSGRDHQHSHHHPKSHRHHRERSRSPRRYN